MAGILVASLVVSSAAAKQFRPGDLSICNATRCVEVKKQSVLTQLAAFYYDTAKPPARTRAPKAGTPFFRLEFSNGYITGIVAGTSEGKFLSYGVNLEQFRGGVWYRVPTRAAAGLSAVAGMFKPLRLANAAPSGATNFAAHGSGAAPAMRPVSRPTPSTGHGGGPWLPVGLVVLAGLIAFVLLTQRSRRAAATRPGPTSANAPLRGASPRS